MSTYISTYIKSLDQEILTKFVFNFKEHIGPFKGSDSFTDTDEYGNEIIIAAKGDSNYWYSSIRSKLEKENIALPEGIVFCEKIEGSQVCGVWAGD